MSLLTEALRVLLARSPSLQAAAKAGKKTTISVRVFRQRTGKWEDLGEIGSATTSWGPILSRLFRPKTVIRYTVDGKEIERTNF